MATTQLIPPDSPQPVGRRIARLGLERTVLLAGGIIAGLSALIATYQFLDQNMSRRDWITIVGIGVLVVIVFAFGQSFLRIYRNLDERYRTAQRMTVELQQKLAKSANLMDLAVAEINRDLFELAASRDTLESFAKDAEKLVFPKLITTFALSRAGWWVPDPLAQFEKLEESQRLASVSTYAQDGLGAQKFDKKALQLTESAQVIQILRKPEMWNQVGSQYSTAFVPIFRRASSDSVWAVLFLYKVDTSVDSLNNEIVKPIQDQMIPNIRQGFERVMEREHPSRPVLDKIKHSHRCAVIHREGDELEIDEEYPIDKTDKSYLYAVIKEHRAFIMEKFISPKPGQPIVHNLGRYNISLIPMDVRGNVRDMLIAVDSVEETNLDEEFSRWLSLNALVKYARKIWAGDRILVIKPALISHLNQIVDKPELVSKIALFALDVEALLDVAPRGTRRDLAITTLENGIEVFFRSTANDPLTLAARYDGTTYLFCIHAENSTTAKHQAIALRDQLVEEVQRELETTEPIPLIVGVAHSRRELNDSSEIIIAAMSALEIADKSPDRFGLQVIDENPVTTETTN